MHTYSYTHTYTLSVISCIYLFINLFSGQERLRLVLVGDKDAELCLHGNGVFITACGYNSALLALYWIPLPWPYYHHALLCPVHQPHLGQGEVI